MANFVGLALTNQKKIELLDKTGQVWINNIIFKILQVDLAEGIPVEVRVTAYGSNFPEVWLQPYTHPTHEKFGRLEHK